VQIALSYSQESRTDLEGQAAMGAHPRGMSGGAVMAMMRANNDTRSISIPFLVGILTQYHQNIDTSVATRVVHLWNATEYAATPNPVYRRTYA
jgi:hypothetical protein